MWSSYWNKDIYFFLIPVTILLLFARKHELCILPLPSLLDEYWVGELGEKKEEKKFLDLSLLDV